MRRTIAILTLTCTLAGCLGPQSAPMASDAAKGQAARADEERRATEWNAVLKQQNEMTREARRKKENESLTACLKVPDIYQPRFDACTERALAEIAPFSQESSDVVAAAVLGRCEGVRVEWIRETRANCWGDESGRIAQSVAGYTERVRSALLGRIAAARASATRRQLERQPQPSVDTPAIPATPRERPI